MNTIMNYCPRENVEIEIITQISKSEIGINILLQRYVILKHFVTTFEPQESL